MKKFRVGILGATGMVGQRFITLLAHHPWFEIAALAASARSAGKTYAEAVDGRWKLEEKMPSSVRDMVLLDAVKDQDRIVEESDFVFSAVNMPKEEIRVLEEAYAKKEVPVISNNSAHRWTPDVPMVIPEINADHYAIIEAQRQRLGTKRGFIAVKPNCSIQAYVPALSAWQEFEPTQILVTTYQAISGAGRSFADWPEMQGNIIPYISGEEEKSEREPLKIWGHIEGQTIVPATGITITSQCLRVPILNGHTAAAFVNFRQKPTKEQLIAALRHYMGEPQSLQLPSAPKHFIQYRDEENRPQVSLDVNYEHGMGVTIGRLRPDALFDWKFVGLAHNTLRGAAGGGVEAAEYLCRTGWIS